MVRYLLDTVDNHKVLLNFINSSYLYRMFLVANHFDLSKQNLDSLGSFNGVLTLFEMSLFNSQVMKHVKSNALITQRDRYFEFLEMKEQEVFLLMERYKDEKSESEQVQQEILKIRFYHAMMFFSFEIKNDMHSSIRYF